MDGGLHENLPYWMNGAVPLAVQLGDTKLFSTIEGFLDIIFKLQQKAGWIGPDTESLATSFFAGENSSRFLFVLPCFFWGYCLSYVLLRTFWFGTKSAELQQCRGNLRSRVLKDFEIYFEN